MLNIRIGGITYYYDIIIDGELKTVKQGEAAGFLSTLFPKRNVGKETFIRYSYKTNNIAPDLSFTIFCLVASTFFIMLFVFMCYTEIAK